MFESKLNGVGGGEWDEVTQNPIGAESAKKKRKERKRKQCPPTQRFGVWLWSWKLLACQHLKKREDFSTESPTTLSNIIGAACYGPIGAITNGQFGSWPVLNFLGDITAVEAIIFSFQLMGINVQMELVFSPSLHHISPGLA